jgi:GT2 family glycosyltransferase
VLTISVIIPVFNAEAWLGQCLDALRRSHVAPLECIVVDDAGDDASASTAEAAGATVLRRRNRRGPAAARNLGAAHARGDILLFIDADVCVHPDTIGRILERFETGAGFDALIGSYDDAPAAPGFVSQYKNLLQHYVHQHGREQAATFWTGCGAIRRDVFLEAGGFDESYTRPSIEDIEFGQRLRAAGRKIVLDPAVMVKHLKRWTLVSLLRSDLFDRALPWTRLIVRSSRLPDDLNLAVSQRLSALLLLLALALAAAGVIAPPLALAALLPVAAVLYMNRGLYRFLAARRGCLFALRAVPLHLLYFIYSAAAFGAGVVIYSPTGQPRAAAQEAPESTCARSDSPRAPVASLSSRR